MPSLDEEIAGLIKTTRAVFTSTSTDSRKPEGIQVRGDFYVEEFISAVQKDEVLQREVIIRGETPQKGHWYSIELDHFLKKYAPQT
ncbi:MAG: hypothetical protein ACP5NS_02275 [Candidatus Pacearchaeota archaeon]